MPCFTCCKSKKSDKKTLKKSTNPTKMATNGLSATPVELKPLNGDATSAKDLKTDQLVSNGKAPVVIESKIPEWDELPAFVKEGFEIVAKNEGLTNSTFSIGSGSNVGDGFMSVMLKVNISGTREDGTKHEFSVICKMPPPTPERREMQHSYDAFRREIFMYNEYLPFLVEFQNSKGIPLEDQFRSFPKCYYAKMDETTGNAIIVMEDLRNAGYAMAPKTEPMTYEACRLVMESFGKLHGLCIAFEKEAVPRFDKYRFEAKDFMHLIMTGQETAPMWEMSFKPALEYLHDEHDAELKATLRKLQGSVREHLLDVCVNNTCYPFGVIGHGDSWINNFMFQWENGRPTTISLIDWQVSRYGSPVLDLSYFLFTSTDKTLRDKYWYQLIGLYYDTLVATINAAGYDGRQLFPFDELQRQLKQFGKYGVIFALLLVPFLQIPNDALPDMDDAIKDWKDNGVEESGMMDMLKHNDSSVTARVADMLRDGKRFGMI